LMVLRWAMGPDSIKSRSSRGRPLIAWSPLSRGSSYRGGRAPDPSPGTTAPRRSSTDSPATA